MVLASVSWASARVVAPFGRVSSMEKECPASNRNAINGAGILSSRIHKAPPPFSYSSFPPMALGVRLSVLP